MIGERLHRARKASGLSLRDLGSVIGISHTAVNKYEKDQLMPSSGQLIELSKALGVRAEYFLRPISVEIKGIEYRKRSNAPKALLSKITADVYDQAERWEELLQLYPHKPVPDFELPDSLPEKINTDADIEKISEQMRHAWELGLNPVPDLIDTLESRGALVILSAVDAAQKFDGLAGEMGSKPVIVVSENWCGDRQRFTLAHELGHLVLKGRFPQAMDEEKACNLFAGAFLLPKPAVLDVFGEHRNALDMNELHMLKEEYGLSMSGIIFRAFQCGVISEGIRKNLIIKFSKMGWRKKEPGSPYPAEKTWLFDRLVYRALAEDYIGESKAAELFGMSLRNFRKESRLELTGAGTYQ
ncbi:MAG: ImmA/IrrE family metallo-endopeptidase [Gammaproteobacteria bacterium]|nr:ImmA/IrrE family metallo-endopeptidase [Gammaproteobacteria bacterium]